MSPARLVDPDCDFCKIISGIEPADLVYEASEALAFLPLNPAAHGHTLVIPKIHVASLWELDRTFAQPLLEATLLVAEAIRLALSPDGLNLINSTGTAASQSIFHLHFHLVPRWHGDHFGEIWPPGRPLDDEHADTPEMIKEGVRRAGVQRAEQER